MQRGRLHLEHARAPGTGGATGLLHDLDYERYTDLGTGHPREALKMFEEKGYQPALIAARNAVLRRLPAQQKQS